MSIEIFFQVIESIAVVIAVGFAIVQVRQYRRDKHREAAMELLHAFQAPDFTKALCIVYAMPEGLSEEEMKKFTGADFHLVYAMATTWESIGVLVCRGEIDLQLVDDFFSGPIRISWCRLEGFIKAERETNERETIFEWWSRRRPAGPGWVSRATRAVPEGPCAYGMPSSAAAFRRSREQGSETPFQWLNERLGEQESEEAPVPANIEYQDWSPKTEWWE